MSASTRARGNFGAARVRHLRPRGDARAQQPITAVELLFDLVFVFAITQLAHLVLADLTVTGLLRAAFLLLVVWWAWINTTWLANWLDPRSTRVRLVLVAGALAALLLAAALPRALADHGLLFARSPTSRFSRGETWPRPSSYRPPTPCA